MHWKNSEEYPYYLPRIKEERGERLKFYKKFISYFKFGKVTAYERPHSLKRLLTGDRSYNAGIQYDTKEFTDWIDHARVFKRMDDNSFILVSQPYHYQESELNQFCEKLNLKYKVFSKEESFYYPHNTYLILIWSANHLDREVNNYGGEQL